MVVATQIVLKLDGPFPSLPGTPNPLCPRASRCTDDEPIAPRRPGSVSQCTIASPSHSGHQYSFLQKNANPEVSGSRYLSGVVCISKHTYYNLGAVNL
ncbi:hypothetical protein JB92DRAFT_178940 [Gautieria morchelliformis]|nr:hypothetical protein JB92DRAFT_178940 [Gautieria morchelliformis]